MSATKGCSQVSNLRQTSVVIAKARIITLYQKGRWGRKEGAEGRLFGCEGQRKRDKKRETWTLREMDAEGVKE